MRLSNKLINDKSKASAKRLALRVEMLQRVMTTTRRARTASGIRHANKVKRQIKNTALKEAGKPTTTSMCSDMHAHKFARAHAMINNFDEEGNCLTCDAEVN